MSATVAPSARNWRTSSQRRGTALGIEARRRLIEDENVRLVREGKGDVEAASLTAGPGASRAIGRLPQFEAVEKGCRTFTGGRARHAEGSRLERELRATGEARIAGASLRDVADPLADLPCFAGEVEAADGGAAGGGPQQRHQHAQEGRLAGAVGSPSHSAPDTRTRTPGRSRRTRPRTCRRSPRTPQAHPQSQQQAAPSASVEAGRCAVAWIPPSRVCAGRQLTWTLPPSRRSIAASFVPATMGPERPAFLIPMV